MTAPRALTLALVATTAASITTLAAHHKHSAASGASAHAQARLPRVDRVLGAWSGWMLLRLTQRAVKRGDMHEARHCTEALTRGNSSDCSPVSCSLDRHAIARWDAAWHRQYLRNVTGEGL